MPGFWVEPEDVEEERLILRGAEAHHLSRVRRYRVGDRIEAVDGRGGFFQAEIVEIGKDRIVCRISARWTDRGESSVKLCLAPALIKGQRFDFIVEKATEVGVDSIAPLMTRRGVVRGGRERKEERWRRLAQAAVKQCGRSRLPRIRPPAELAAAIEELMAEGRTVLMGVPAGRGEAIGDVLRREKPGMLALLVGPEGGFAPEEEELAKEAGVRFFSWGSRILRADTASIVLAALVIHEAEQLCG
jgi:16S rRNA (uracil1498-N3)-methyltransferase